MNEDRVKVLYIGGYSRSGSTLLLRLLGQMDGFIGVGEVWDIWARSFAENQLCGCGKHFRDCEFWQAVVKQAFGGFEQVDVEAMQALRHAVQSNHHIPHLALPFLRSQGYQEKIDHYKDILGRLYQGIHDASGGKIIVDSSKVPTYAILLNQVKNIDLNIIHLVRDSRATAYSWQRKKVRPEITWKTAYMGEYSPVKSAMEWNVMNGLLHTVKLNGTRYMHIRYEELVEKPRETILRIVAFSGHELPDINFFENRQAVNLGVDHTLSGNPNRFQLGAVKIRPDVEWQNKMTKRDKTLVTALTWPMMLPYGYFSRDHLNKTSTEPDTVPVRRKNHTNHAEIINNWKPLKILLVTARYLPFIGGTEIHTHEVARRLAAAGNNVTVLATNPGQKETTTEVSEGVRVIRVPAWPVDQDYFFAPAMYRIIRQGNWDIIHCQGYHTLVAPIVMLAAWQAKIPYIVTFHSGGHSSKLRNALRPLQRALLRPLLARAAGLVGVSNWEADFFKEHLGFPGERFTVIPNGSYLPKVENLSVSNGKGPLIISIGRLERYKGHHRVITGMPQVLRQYPGAHLRIVGTGPYEPALRQLAQDLGISDHVEIKAVASSDRGGMAAVLMGASLVILLSDYESQGISALEALALGRPVLVADSTALNELASSGLARATSLGGTPEEVAIAILDQLQQPLIPLHAELPTWDACALDLLALYQQTVIQRVECVS